MSGLCDSQRALLLRSVSADLPHHRTLSLPVPNHQTTIISTIEARNDHPVYTSHLPIRPFRREKGNNAFDRREIPSPAIFICCIFRQFSSPSPTPPKIMPGHLAKRGSGQAKRAALLRRRHVCVLVLILQKRKPGCLLRGGRRVLGVFQGEISGGRQI